MSKDNEVTPEDLLRAIFNLFLPETGEHFLAEISRYHKPEMADLYLKLMYDWGIWDPNEKVEEGHCDLCGEFHKDPVQYG